MSQDPTPRELGYYMALAQTGVEMVAPAILGHFVDNWLGTTPWIMISAAVMGFAGGLIHMITILNKKEREETKDQKPPP